MAPVNNIPSQSTLRMLLERLNWPVRMVRWMAAREYAALLSSPTQSKRAAAVYLEWLSKRTLENQVISGLAVLLCASHSALPPFAEVATHINRRSLLSDILLQEIYHLRIGAPGWAYPHSGAVPDSFNIKKYFDEHKSAHVPFIISNHIAELERRTGFPFMRQWAFEWQNLMDATKAPYSDFPYHFVGSYLRTGVIGQFDQAQADVYRSAYLRALAFGVVEGIIPGQSAAFYALDCLPLNRGLLDLKPIQRPVWLGVIPERCCAPESNLEALTRELVKSGSDARDVRPVSLHIPINADLNQFGELLISAVLATKEFVPKDDDDGYFDRQALWIVDDHLSYAGPLDKEDHKHYISSGQMGACLPVCLSLTPLPFGFWHGEYFHSGMTLPAAYNFEMPPDVTCLTNEIVISREGSRLGSLAVWHDHWTPLYAKNGNTRCGMVTELRLSDLADAQD
jgi:hypothetical protein